MQINDYYLFIQIIGIPKSRCECESYHPMRWVKMTKSCDDDILHVERRIFEECGRPVNPKRTAHASQAKYSNII